MKLFNRKPKATVQDAPTEKRNYTSQVVAALQAAVAGDSGDPYGLSTVQACAGLWARSMAMATIDPDNNITNLVNPIVMYNMGRQLLLTGECVYIIRIDNNGQLQLINCQDFDISGGLDWRYKCTVGGPTTNTTFSLPQESVIHVRINTHASEPHKGISPVMLPFTSVKFAAELDQMLKDEAAGNHGYVIPAPTEGMSEDDLRDLKSDLTNIGGKTLLVPTMQRGWSDQNSSPGANNWAPRHIGFNPEDGIVNMHKAISVNIIGSCGVPPELLVGGADGTGRREAWRQFLHGTIQPIADVISVELSNKLDQNITLSFDRLFASDVQGRARAFNSLTSGGLSVQDAARATGVSYSE